MLFVHKSLFVTLCQTPTLALARPRREYSRVSRYRKDLAELETAKPSLLVWKVNVDAVTFQMLKLGADGVRFICPAGRHYPHVDAYSGRADCARRRFFPKTLHEEFNDLDWLRSQVASVASRHRDLAISPHARAEREESSLLCKHLLSERQQWVQQGIKVWMRHASLL